MDIKIKNLSTYITILIVPCVIGIFAYNIIINELIQDVHKIQSTTLNGMIKDVDNDINSTYDVILNITNNEKVNDFNDLSNISQAEALRKAIAIKDEIKNIRSKNIIDTIIFFKNSDTVISTSYVTTIQNFYNDNYLNNFKSFDEFYNSICGYKIVVKSSKEQTYEYDNRSIPVISFVKSINKDINVMVLLDINEIESNFSNISYDTGMYVLRDNKDNVILNNVDEIDDLSLLTTSDQEKPSIKNINGSKVIVTNETSDLNDWNYSLIQPYDKVINRVSYIKTLIVRYVIIYLIIGLILSLYWSKKNQLRFNKIINIIVENIPSFTKESNSSKIDNDIVKIQNYMQEFNKNSKLMEENSVKQKEIIKNLILNKLISGNFNTNDEIDKSIKVLENESFYKANKFMVCVIKGQSLLEENNKIILKELLIKLNNNNFEICDNQDNSIILIIYSLDIDVKSELIKMSESLIKSYNKNAEDIIIGVGGEYSSKLDIYKSYQEAYIAIDSRLINSNLSNLLCIYSKDKKDNDRLFYPIEMELRLINCTKLGLKDEVDNILNEIIDENFYGTKMNIINVRALMFELHATLIRIINEIDVSNISSDLLKEIENLYEVLYKERPNKLIIIIEDTYYKLCSEILKGKKKFDDVLSGNLINYIECEFANPNLTIAEVANEFSISSGYAAKIIKHCTGETFFSYLENIRMEHAQTLIDTTDLPIYDIAEKSGYQLSATFCRAYKRRYNISPNKSREMKRENLKNSNVI